VRQEVKEEDLKIFNQLPDEKAMAIVIAGEVRGEPDDPAIPGDETHIMIGSIVLNRADYGKIHHGWGKLYGDSVKSVIMAKNQFSCLSSNDKNYSLLMGLMNDYENSFNTLDWFKRCHMAASCLLANVTQRNVTGLFYETIDSHVLWNQFLKRDGKPPEVEAIIGKHRVYKTI
jgi:hypothetical protein